MKLATPREVALSNQHNGLDRQTNTKAPFEVKGLSLAPANRFSEEAKAASEWLVQETRNFAEWSAEQCFLDEIHLHHPASDINLAFNACLRPQLEEYELQPGQVDSLVNFALLAFFARYRELMATTPDTDAALLPN